MRERRCDNFLPNLETTSLDIQRPPGRLKGAEHSGGVPRPKGAGGFINPR